MNGQLQGVCAGCSGIVAVCSHTGSDGIAARMGGQTVAVGCTGIGIMDGAGIGLIVDQSYHRCGDYSCRAGVIHTCGGVVPDNGGACGLDLKGDHCFLAIQLNRCGVKTCIGVAGIADRRRFHTLNGTGQCCGNGGTVISLARSKDRDGLLRKAAGICVPALCRDRVSSCGIFPIMDMEEFAANAADVFLPFMITGLTAMRTHAIVIGPAMACVIVPAGILAEIIGFITCSDGSSRYTSRQIEVEFVGIQRPDIPQTVASDPRHGGYCRLLCHSHQSDGLECDRVSAIGQGAVVVTRVASSDALCPLATGSLDIAAGDDNIAARTISAAANAGALFTAGCSYGTAGNGNTAACSISVGIVVFAAADTGAIFTAGGADDASADGDIAARTGFTTADACASVSADCRHIAIGDGHRRTGSVAAAANAGALFTAPGSDGTAGNGDLRRIAVGIVAIITAANARAIFAAGCIHGAAVDNNNRSNAAVTAAHTGSRVTTLGRHIAAVDGNGACCALFATADTGAIFTAGGIDRAAVNGNGARIAL